jgi:hypothetical protein
MPADDGRNKGDKNNKRKGNNQSENEKARKIAKKYNMSPEEQEQFHHEVTKQGYNTDELERAAQSLVERAPGEKRIRLSKAERRKRGQG